MITLFHLLAINFDVNGVSINAYVNAKEKKADNVLRNKNRTKNLYLNLYAKILQILSDEMDKSTLTDR